MAKMEQFWDAKAREDAYWFVDSRLKYNAPDEQAFWQGGVDALTALTGTLGVELAPGQVVVDIGCGLGRLTRPLAARAEKVYAIDVSSEMLARARQLNESLDNVEWLHGDGQSLQPVPDGAADVCISHVVFRHIPDPAITLAYIREMGRVLKPGGFTAFELSNDPEPHRRGRVTLRGRMSAIVGRAPKGGENANWLGSYVDLDDVRSAAADGGLEVERIEGQATEYCAVLARRRAQV